jgi:TolB protein
VGDGLAGSCVPDTGLPSGSKPPSSCKLRVAFEEGQVYPNVPNREVWITNTDGSEPTNLSQAPTADDYGARWSPDGQKLLFLSNRTNVYHVYVVDADGGNLIDLTPNSLKDITTAEWSPDGSRIAFVRVTENGGSQTYIAWVMSANGANAAQVSDLNVLELVGWSPDSQRLLISQWVSTPTLAIVLVVVSSDAEHSSNQQLSTYIGYVGHAGWAPGPQVVWDDKKDIFTASTDLKIIRNVTEDTNHINTRPRMSRDGQTIVFESDISGNGELWSVSTGGGLKTRLTHSAAGISTNDVSGDVLGDIADDGSMVTFVRIPQPQSGQTDIVGNIGVVDIHGVNLNLFNSPGGTNARGPRFSHCPSTSMALHHPDRPGVLASALK